MPRITRRRVWTIVGVAWLVAAAGSVAILVWTGQKLPIWFGPRPGPVRADCLIGSWEWHSSNPNVKHVETFAADGSWTLRAEGYTPKGPTRAWWSTFFADEAGCAVVFREDRIADNGPLRTFTFDGADTIREASGNMLNLKTLTRVRDTK